MTAATSVTAERANGAGLAGAAVEPGAVGSRIRSLREGMNLSLRELAERCGVSATTLSQVERGESSPSLTVAGRIADGLELSLSQLLRLDEGRHLVIVRAGTGRRRERSGHAVEELTPPLPGQRADVSIHTLAAGAATGGADDPPLHEPGSRETVVVVDGAVELLVDGEAHELAAGDSATFDADLPHNLHNPGPAPARLLAVVAAGLRRG
jgi:XRE family transcriptional regulator, regulator of sulfur utilization